MSSFVGSKIADPFVQPGRARFLEDRFKSSIETVDLGG